MNQLINSNDLIMSLDNSTIDDAMRNAPNKSICDKCWGIGFEPVSCCAGYECDCNGGTAYIYCSCGTKPDVEYILKLSEL